METVIAELAPDKQDDQQTYSHAGGQPQNIDQGEGLPLEQASNSDFQVVPEHRKVVLVYIGPCACPYVNIMILVRTQPPVDALQRSGNPFPDPPCGRLAF